MCLSCFTDEEEKDISDLKIRLRDLNGSVFRPVKNFAQLKVDLANPLLLKDLDILILVAHAYETGKEFKMRDGTYVPVGAVVTAIKQGKLPERASVFLFSCNGIMSPEWHELFANDQGPRMIFGPTRVARSVPLSNVLIRAEDGLLRKGLPKDQDEARAALDRFLAPRNKDGSGEPARFMGHLWGPSTAEAYRPEA